MKVEVVESTLVAPSEETPRQGLWLSNLDLAVPKTHTPLVYYYPAPAPAPAPAGDGGDEDGGGGFFSPGRLRAALAKALVLFYPLAGRLGVDGGGRLQIDCNGEGALFNVARADFAGDDVFGRYEPSPEVRRMFVPLAPSGDPPCLMSMFQVTFLKCGGVVLGTGIHHVTMDGMGAFHFIQTWTGLARGLPVSEACPSPPSHDRTLLRARSPPAPEFEHPVYSPAFLNGTPRPFVTRVYTVSPKLLAGLKAQCSPAGASTYAALTAHLWRCACAARGLAQGSDTRLRVPANVRHRVRPPLPRQLFANAIVRDLVTAKAGDVVARPLGSVADKIRKAVDHVDDAYVRSVVDYLEMEPGKGAGAARGTLMPESDLWVVSWLGMPVYDADFGWGAPRLVAPAQMFGSGTAYVTQRGADREDGVAVLFALEPQYLRCFEDVFYGE